MKIPSKTEYDPKTIKDNVSLAGVIMALGVDLSMEMNGDFTGLCPFHNDTRPSLSVYIGAGGQKWSCWACSLYGDVYDFVQRFTGCSFAESKSKVIAYRDSGELPDPPDVVSKRRADPKDLVAYLDRSRGVSGVLPELIEDRGIAVPLAWIRNEWGVCDDMANVYIPHYDMDGDVVGLKKRWHLDWVPIAEPGSDLSHLYGCWKDQGRQDVILCEGESDTWLVSYLLRDSDYEVFGLPHGVCGPTQEWVATLTGRNITLLFDSDSAGRTAVEKWLSDPAVNAYLGLKVAILPDGADCNSARSDVVIEAIESAMKWEGTADIKVRIERDRYVYTNAQGEDVPVSDFTFDVQRLVIMQDTMLYEVEVPGKSEAQFLMADDLTSRAKLRVWTTKRMLAWSGSDNQITELSKLLKAQSITVPRVKGVDVVGLHQDVFVLPDKCLGSSGWGYVPPENDTHLIDFLHVEEEPWDLTIILHLLQLHDIQVMSPVLGWIAAAPFRSLFEQFPILSVTGGSGWGKTTILHTVLRSFGFWTKSPPTLTGSTPHAILSYASSTNSIPIWFDEYRPGARLDARMALDQVIRDAYDGSSRISGGMYESKMKIKAQPACAPLIVSGEDAFIETSHIERMVLVNMPKEGKNSSAWTSCNAAKVGGLGFAYLSWCLEQLRAGLLPPLPRNPDRAAHSLGVAEWGYTILNDFTTSICGYYLPEFDGSRCAYNQKVAKDRPVILEAIDLTRNVQDANNTMISFVDSSGDGYVKTQSLCKWCQTHSDIKLPGGSKAVQRWLEEMYGAESVRHPVLGRCMMIPNLLEVLGELDA
jgi:5S rRNA maturation endonuclease (ribonuclease M5)